MDNWGEIIYVNEEQQKVGERAAEGQRRPSCARLGRGSGWPRLEMGGWGCGGLGPIMGPQGS